MKILSVGLLLVVLLCLSVGSTFAQTATPEPTSEPSSITGADSVDVPSQTVVTVPVLWGGASVLFYFIYACFIVYAIVRIILGFVPGA